MNEQQPQTRGIRRLLRDFVLHSVLHADDPPHRLALGIAIGLFVTFTPTVGFQTVIVIFLAWLFNANKVVGVPLVWITNPVTIVPIFYTCYRVGRLALRQPGVGFGWWTQLTQPPEGWWDGVAFYSQRFAQIAAPLWLGSIFVGFLLATAAYYISYYAIYGYRMKRWGQLLPPSAILIRQPDSPAPDKWKTGESQSEPPESDGQEKVSEPDTDGPLKDGPETPSPNA